MKNAIKAIENYIFGKDGNRPDLLRYAFSPDATLNMEVQTSAILFPPHVQGRKDIADVLVRDFSLHYENVLPSASEHLQSPKLVIISANGWLA
ncbi:hypothetical protein P0D92_23565 [Pseudomonas sp. CBSPAW29]|nr:hypothetical protein P0D92_23565 [Pseudomonas sp. CBSPAW29]